MTPELLTPANIGDEFLVVNRLLKRRKHPNGAGDSFSNSYGVLDLIINPCHTLFLSCFAISFSPLMFPVVL